MSGSVNAATIGFAIIAACMIFAALRTVSSRDLVHGVLWLGLTLGTTAALFVMLGAPFLAGVQVLLYVGGVMVLMIFGVMLTRRAPEEKTALSEATKAAAPRRRGFSTRGALLAAGLFGIMAGVLTRGELLPAGKGGPVPTVDIGRALFQPHAIAFEVLSVLLLAAMLGAIVVARRRDPGAGNGAAGSTSNAEEETR